MSKPFVKLEPAPFPGAVTRIQSGLRPLKEGDIISIEWHHNQPALGQDVAGKVKYLAMREGVGKFGAMFEAEITLEAGWYSMGLDHILTPVPGSEEDEGESVLSFKPTVNRADWEHTFKLSTTDQPHWDLFIIGGSDERLAEIADLVGKSVEELTARHR
ncbi:MULTISPECIES: hypothetical protein [Streptomyces]|uniref:hypothetical protein n=1 Tax=Streptomyces TaxID=1883 RepID=UPI00365EA669